jgi:hypothetical protein
VTTSFVRALVPTLFVAVLGAQQNILIDPAVQDAWRQFQRNHPGAWQADWSPATGTPRAIWGPGLPLHSGPIASLAVAREHADAVLERHAALLGRGGSSFVLDIGQKVLRVHVFVYRQVYRGLPVIDGRADVRVHDSGGVSLFGSEALPIPAGFDVQPRIAAEEAILVALQSQQVAPPAGPLAAPPPSRLVVWGDVRRAQRTPVALAWEVKIHDEASKKVGRVYVDALQGMVLDYRNDYHECSFGCAHGAHATPAAPRRGSSGLRHEVEYGQPTGRVNVTGNVKGWTNTGLGPNDPLQNIPLRGVRVTIQGGNFAYTDANGDFDISHGGTAPVTLTVSFAGALRVAAVNAVQGTTLNLNVPATPGTPVAVQIYTQTAIDFDKAQTTAYWLTDQINEYCRAIIGALPPATDQVQARVNLAQTCNAYYTANTINFYAAGGNCPNTAYKTVVEHEWGHGLDDRYGGISQTEGLSEGWGDLLATYYTGQPIVGKDFLGPNTLIRTALNTRTRGSCTEVHCAGESWMGWAWDVRNNLIISLGQAPGIARAEKIVVASIVANARDQNTAAREVFILDDDDNNLGNGTPNCNALAKACTKRNIANPTPCTGSQVPGAYTLFGTGCQGTGSSPSTCFAINDTLPRLVASTRASLIYAIRFTAPANLNVNGFAMQTGSPTGAQTLNAYLYDEAIGGTPGNQIATGTIQVGAANAWYSAAFSAPVACQSGRNYFVAFQNSANVIDASVVNGGTITPYFRNDGNPWSTVQTGFAWAFRVLCVPQGNAVPTLANDGVPEIGARFDLKLALAKANTGAVLFVGNSNTTWGSIALPLDLVTFGAPTCFLRVSPDIQAGLATDAVGGATVPITLPIDNSMVGLSFHNQFAIADSGANALGVAVTNGGTGRIGKP